MNVVFLAPDIHDLPTGGNIYNRRVIAALRERPGVAVEVVHWPADRPAGESTIEAAEAADRFPLPSGADAVVVDSLLVAHDGAIRRLRRTHSQARWTLLAHYLHCVDPARAAGEAAERERALLPVFDGAITTSAYVRDRLAGEGLDAGAVSVVPPGLDDVFRAPLPAEGEAIDGGEAVDGAGEGPAMLTVANVLPGKGLGEMVDVLASLSGALEATEATWTLVGNESLDPDFAASFRETVAASPVRDRIALAGTVAEDEMRAVYDAHDVCVVPSRFETCSMSTREAMARGLAVVAYAVGGLPENFAPGGAGGSEGGASASGTPSGAPSAYGAGRLVEPGDAAALAEALREVLTDAELRRGLGEAARARSASFPSWPDTARRFADALRGG